MFIDLDNPLAAEILREAGDAYFSGCKKILASLEALRAFESVVGSLGEDSEQVTRRSQLIEDAAERVHFVCRQRTHLHRGGSEELACLRLPGLFEEAHGAVEGCDSGDVRIAFWPAR